MRKANEQDRERILEYLKKDIVNCLYLYIDITNHGVSTEYLNVWLQEWDDQIELVAMKYYDSYQIYSHKTDGDLKEICRLFRKDPVLMISGRKDLIERLEEKLPEYKATYGVVFYIGPYGEARESIYDLSCATEADAMDIAKLMCADPVFGTHYTVEGLGRQLADRIRNGTGRSFIARNERGEIIAHMASFAEAEEIAVISGSIVAPDYRYTDVYEQLDNFVGYQMMLAHKRTYAFAATKKMIYLQNLYGTVCGEYGKLERIR